MSIKTNKNNKRHSYVISKHDIFNCCIEKINTPNNGSSVIIPHVCNNIDSFGAGFAAFIADKFPIVKMNYHMLGKSFLRSNLGYCQIIKVIENNKTKNSLYVANMIAQNGVISPSNTRPLNYLALTKSMSAVASFINSQLKNNESSTDIFDIHCPRFGSGLAGGNWYFISDLIDDIWSKFNVTVHILGK